MHCKTLYLVCSLAYAQVPAWASEAPISPCLICPPANSCSCHPSCLMLLTLIASSAPDSTQRGDTRRNLTEIICYPSSPIHIYRSVKSAGSNLIYRILANL